MRMHERCFLPMQGALYGPRGTTVPPEIQTRQERALSKILSLPGHVAAGGPSPPASCLELGDLCLLETAKIDVGQLFDAVRWEPGLPANPARPEPDETGANLLSALFDRG